MRPLVMTKAQAGMHYRLSAEKAEQVCSRLVPVGFYLRKDNPLFSRADIEKEIKNG